MEKKITASFRRGKGEKVRQELTSRVVTHGLSALGVVRACKPALEGSPLKLEGSSLEPVGDKRCR